MIHNLQKVKMKKRGSTIGLSLPINRPSPVVKKLCKHCTCFSTPALDGTSATQVLIISGWGTTHTRVW